MKKRNAWIWFLAGTLAALLLVGLAFGAVNHAVALSKPALPASAAVAVPDRIITTSPIVISGAGFASDGTDPTGIYFWFNGGFMSGGPDSCFEAPVYLPPGAYIKDVYASVYDNDPSTYVSATLFRSENYSGVVDILGSGYTNAEGDYMQYLHYTVGRAYQEVTYPTYSYYIGSCALSNMVALYSVRVYWVYEYNLPLVFNH
jgi:hypothetical protein